MLPIFVSMAFAAAAYLSLSGLSDSESLVIHPWSNPRLHLSLCLLSALSARRVALLARRAFRSNRSSSLFDFAIRSPVPSLPAAPGASPLFMVHVTAVANTQVGILPDVLAPTPTEARHTESQSTVSAPPPLPLSATPTRPSSAPDVTPDLDRAVPSQCLRSTPSATCGLSTMAMSHGVAVPGSFAIASFVPTAHLAPAFISNRSDILLGKHGEPPRLGIEGPPTVMQEHQRERRYTARGHSINDTPTSTFLKVVVLAYALTVAIALSAPSLIAADKMDEVTVNVQELTQGPPPTDDVTTKAQECTQETPSGSTKTKKTNARRKLKRRASARTAVAT